MPLFFHLSKVFFNDLAFLCITQMKYLLFVGLGAVLDFIDAAILIITVYAKNKKNTQIFRIFFVYFSSLQLVVQELWLQLL